MNIRLNEYRETSKYCDFKLVINDKVFPVHKVVLSAASPYFEAMFSNNLLETENSSVDLVDVNEEIISLLLNFIYLGEIDITMDVVQEVARVANRFDILDLCHYCAKFLEDKITVENCIAILVFANMHDFTTLCIKARRFSERYFSEIIQTEDFLELPASTLKLFLKSENLSIHNELEVLQATLRWIIKDEESRMQYLTEFVDIIRMPLINDNNILDLMKDFSHYQIVDTLNKVLEHKATGDKVGYNLIRHEPRLCSRRSIYLLCGFQVKPFRNDSSALKEVLKLDLQTYEWTEISSVNIPRCCHCSVLLGGSIYILGGQCESLTLDSVEIYNAKADKWSFGTRMNEPRTKFAACVSNSCIYVIGGNVVCGKSNIEKYDPKTDKWDVVFNLPKHLSGHKAVSYNNLIFIIGGTSIQSNKKAESSLYLFRPKESMFQCLTKMNRARSMFGCTIMRNYVYVFGGIGENGEPLNSAEQYNILEVSSCLSQSF